MLESMAPSTAGVPRPGCRPAHTPHSRSNLCIRHDRQTRGLTCWRLRRLQARREVELREGAQVMLTRNVSAKRGLVNGARGVIERFIGNSIRLPVVRFASVRTFSKSCHVH